MLRKAWRASVAAFNRVFRGRHHVYRLEPGPRPACPGLAVERYDRPEDVPDDIRQAVRRWGGEKAWTWDVREMDDGAALWIGRLVGAVAAAWMSRPGSLFRAWFVPLRAEDVVLFRGTTAPELRGRGIGPAMMREIAGRSLASEARVYVDVAVHNAPSIRAIEKAGFRRIATCRPVSRKDAYA
ncbi:MAG TPA: GNAT family N-acetyltransferase [Planctomycetota bacterium]